MGRARPPAFSEPPTARRLNYSINSETLGREALGGGHQALELADRIRLDLAHALC
jgi:hypothetical protein